MEEKEEYNNENSSYSRCIRYPDKADKPDRKAIKERVQKRVLKTFSGFDTLEILKAKIKTQKHRRKTVLLSKIALLIVNKLTAATASTGRNAMNLWSHISLFAKRSDVLPMM